MKKSKILLLILILTLLGIGGIYWRPIYMLVMTRPATLQEALDFGGTPHAVGAVHRWRSKDIYVGKWRRFASSGTIFYHLGLDGNPIGHSIYRPDGSLDGQFNWTPPRPDSGGPRIKTMPPWWFGDQDLTVEELTRSREATGN